MHTLDANPRITIVIPTYNEAENLELLLEKIFALPLNISVIVVDDNSPDGTAGIARRLSERFPVQLIVRPRKLGLGSAYREGFRRALENNTDLVMEMDADFSHDPSVIPQFVQAIRDGVDVVIGSRRIPGGSITDWSFSRRFASASAMWLSRLVLGLQTHDVTSGFRCFRADVVRMFLASHIQSNGYAFQEETLYVIEQKNFRVKEIPIVFRDRRYGQSKLSRKEVIAFFVTLLRLRFRGVPRRHS